MNPTGLMSCTRNRKLPIDEKRNTVLDCFAAIENVKERLSIVDTLKVSDDVKTVIKESLDDELNEIKNDMYEIIESINTTTI